MRGKYLLLLIRAIFQDIVIGTSRLIVDMEIVDRFVYRSVLALFFVVSFYRFLFG